MHHHALFTQRVSCTLCQTERRFKGLAWRFLGSCVSGCALARDFLVLAPPLSASWKPFPGAESRDRFASVGDRFPNIQACACGQNAESRLELDQWASSVHTRSNNPLPNGFGRFAASSCRSPIATITSSSSPSQLDIACGASLGGSSSS